MSDTVEKTEIKAFNKVASAFNLWMDEYVNDPKRFAQVNETALNHVKEKLHGYQITYGDRALATLKIYIEKVIDNENNK